MNTHEWLQTIIFFVVLLVLIKPFGSFMATVFQGERTFLSPVLAACEKIIYRICGVKPEDEMGWQRYAGAMLLFNLALFMALFVMLMTQHLLPLSFILSLALVSQGVIQNFSPRPMPCWTASRFCLTR